MEPRGSNSRSSYITRELFTKIIIIIIIIITNQTTNNKS